MPPLPQFQQCVLQERHGPWLTPHLIENGGGQVGLKAQPDSPRLPLDRRAQFHRIHRGDQPLVRLHRRPQCGVWRALPPEVGPHRQHHWPLCGQRQHSVEEGHPQVLVSAESEDLLELVDDHHPRGVGQPR